MFGRLLLYTLRFCGLILLHDIQKAQRTMVFLELTHRDLTLYVCDLLLLNCIRPKLKL